MENNKKVRDKNTYAFRKDKELARRAGEIGGKLGRKGGFNNPEIAIEAQKRSVESRRNNKLKKNS